MIARGSVEVDAASGGRQKTRAKPFPRACSHQNNSEHTSLVQPSEVMARRDGAVLPQYAGSYNDAAHKLLIVACLPRRHRDLAPRQALAAASGGHAADTVGATPAAIARPRPSTNSPTLYACGLRT